MTDNTKDTTKRKEGGPAERLSWLVSNAKDVTPGAFRLLVVLADHAKHDGTAYPSWARLKELTGVSHSSIDRQLAKLKAAGLVILTHHGKGSRTVNHYQLSGAINGWVSSPVGGTSDDVDTLVENEASSPVGGTGNPGTNPGINPPHLSEGGVNNPREGRGQGSARPSQGSKGSGQGSGRPSRI